MSLCGHQAVLVITRTVEGTSTTVARSRTVLTCGLPQGHTGAHHDTKEDERWDGTPGARTTLLRHEDGDTEK
jgi:hypothetical protein